MKRYAMGYFKGAPAMFEQPDGEYVKAADMLAALDKPAEGWSLNRLLNTVRNLRAALGGVPTPCAACGRTHDGGVPVSDGNTKRGDTKGSS